MDRIESEEYVLTPRAVAKIVGVPSVIGYAVAHLVIIFILGALDKSLVAQEHGIAIGLAVPGVLLGCLYLFVARKVYSNRWFQRLCDAPLIGTYASIFVLLPPVCLVVPTILVVPWADNATSNWSLVCIVGVLVSYFVAHARVLKLYEAWGHITSGGN